MAIALLLCLGLILAPAILAQDSGHNGDVGEHEEDDGHEEENGHDGNETHEEEYHDPWMNLSIVGAVIVAFMVAVVAWPRK
jgi:hypothetical protein